MSTHSCSTSSLASSISSFGSLSVWINYLSSLFFMTLMKSFVFFLSPELFDLSWGSVCDFLIELLLKSARDCDISYSSKPSTDSAFSFTAYWIRSSNSSSSYSISSSGTSESNLCLKKEEDGSTLTAGDRNCAKVDWSPSSSISFYSSS
jgi:hypothetical protein